MARISFFEADQRNRPVNDELVSRIRNQRGGRLPNLYRVLLNSPALCDHWLGFFTTLRFKTEIQSEYRELAILRIAILNRAPYEFNNHVQPALKAGLSQSQIDAINQWQVSDCFNSNEKSILAYTDAMTKDIQVPESVFAPLKSFLDNERILELTMVIASYNMVSRFLEALDIDHD